MKKLITILATILLLSISSLTQANELTDCLTKEVEKLNQLPVKTKLTMLDGQEVNLSDFDSYYLVNPMATLPDKFYYWKSEVKTIKSKNMYGKYVEHKVRVYYNLGWVCSEELRDLKNELGSIAEIYNDLGEFMGFVVGVGGGQYIPLVWPGYKKKTSV